MYSQSVVMLSVCGVSKYTNNTPTHCCKILFLYWQSGYFFIVNCIFAFQLHQNFLCICIFQIEVVNYVHVFVTLTIFQLCKMFLLNFDTDQQTQDMPVIMIIQFVWCQSMQMSYMCIYLLFGLVTPSHKMSFWTISAGPLRVIVTI